MIDKQRRGFCGKAFGAVAGVGALAALIPAKMTWDPLPSVVSAGFTTVDISPLKPNALDVVVWRGKPVFILKYTEEMKPVGGRSVKIGDHYFSVMIGLCTHLGCIPAYEPDAHLFKCACHGGEYNAAGVNTFGPPPRPLDIPPFKINGNTLVLGEQGAEYEQLMAENKA